MLQQRSLNGCMMQQRHTPLRLPVDAAPPARVPLSRKGLRVTCTAAFEANNPISADSAAPVASKCPVGFSALSSSSITRAKLSQEQIRQMKGPGWSALQHGDANNLPEAQGKANWNPLQFILGDFPELERVGEVPFLLQRYKQFGPVFKWKLGPHPFIAVLEHDTVRDMLQHADGKVMSFWSPPAIAAFNSPESTANMENPAARLAQRKTLAPGFSRQALRKVIAKIDRICAAHLEDWAAAGRAVDLATEGRELSFDFSTQLLVNFNVPDERRAVVKNALDTMFKGLMAAPVNLPGTKFSNGVKAKNELVEEIKHIIASATSSTDGSSAFELMAQALRESKTDGELSDESLAESGISLLLAGTDTSGQGSQAALAMVALFPEVMEKLRQEQERIIAEHGPAYSLRVLDDMPYAEAVIKEALRLAPPAGAAMRRTLIDLEICGKFVPAGSLIYLSTLISSNFTDPSLKPSGLSSMNPQDLDQLAAAWKHIKFDLLNSEFHPERWLKYDTQFAKSSGLMTFSVGPHQCLGMTLFMTEAKVLLAQLARGYDIKAERPEDLAFSVMVTAQLQSNDGSRVRFVKRDTASGAGAAALAGADQPEVAAAV